MPTKWVLNANRTRKRILVVEPKNELVFDNNNDFVSTAKKTSILLKFICYFWHSIWLLFYFVCFYFSTVINSIWIGTNCIMGFTWKMCRNAMAIGWTIEIGGMASWRKVFCVVTYRWFFVYVAIATSTKTTIPLFSAWWVTLFLWIQLNLQSSERNFIPVTITYSLVSEWLKSIAVAFMLFNFPVFIYRKWNSVVENGKQSKPQRRYHRTRNSISIFTFTFFFCSIHL